MKRLLAGAAALVAAGVAARWLCAKARTPGAVKDPHASRRWLAVTVNRRPEEVMPGGRVPERLANLDVEVRVARAPGDRGAELYARPRRPVPTGIAGVVARLRGDDPRQEVRRALRETKSLIETGEVLRPDSPFAVAPPTLPGKVLQTAVRRAPGEGRL